MRLSWKLKELLLSYGMAILTMWKLWNECNGNVFWSVACRRRVL
uniref:Uncharacterized protein n=1 Tax=Arundo donax TaxID=35708 RepID=A0A0A8ZZZ8_ARUDO